MHFTSLDYYVPLSLPTHLRYCHFLLSHHVKVTFFTFTKAAGNVKLSLSATKVGHVQLSLSTKAAENVKLSLSKKNCRKC